MDELSADLSLRQLEYLAAVVELGSVSRAAALLHVSQPTVSHQLAVLERRVGTPLLARSGRGVVPTAAGRSLAGTARRLLDLGRRGLDDARRAGTAEEPLTVAIVSSLATVVLPDALAELQRTHPAAVVVVREHLRRDDLLRALARGEGDLGIAVPPDPPEGPVHVLGVERYVLVVPPGSPFVGRRTPLPLDRLAEAGWVLFDVDHGLHPLVQQACAAAGFVPRPAVRTRQIDTAVRLAAAGLGPALVPSVSVPVDLAHLVVAPRPAIARPIAAFGPALATPAAQRFLALLTPARTHLAPA